MAAKNNLSEIEARCGDILRSPYLFKDLPSELQKLRMLLTKVERLTREDVPGLIAEIKRLRTELKATTES